MSNVPNRGWFYYANAARPLNFGGREIKFDPMSVQAGRVGGVYQAQDDVEHGLLMAAAGSRVGVSVLTEEDVARLQKKSNKPGAISRNSLNGPRALEQVPVLKVVDNGAPSAASAAPPPVETYPSVKNLIQIGKVSPPQPLIDPASRLNNNWKEPVEAKPAKPVNIKIRHIGKAGG